MKRHAYMILAHHQFDLLKQLLRLLDDDRNDIYVHVDAKVEDFDATEYASVVTRSRLVFVERTSIAWGGYSMIHSELLLLKEATRTPHSYYHLLSGADLPLKTQDTIHEFFDEHDGTEFVHFNEYSTVDVDVRVNLYHVMQERFGRREGKLIGPARNASLRIQRMVGINRLRRAGVAPRYGSQWFSITEALAHFVVSKEAEIRRAYRMSKCGDEIFLQTLIWDTDFMTKLYYDKLDGNYVACLRLVDWERGNPYTFRSGDLAELQNAPHIFARKFDLTVDEHIVERLAESLTGGQ